MDVDQLQMSRRLVEVLPGLAVNLRLASLLDQAGSELTPHQLLVLFLVHESEDHTVRTEDLAGLLGVSKPSVTALVDRLVDGGFLRRDRGSDRRVVLLTLSDVGYLLVDTLTAGLVERIATVLESMDEMARSRLEMALSEVATFAELVGGRGTSMAGKRELE